MFTGIVQGVVPVVEITDREGLRTLVIELGEARVVGLELGASVAIDGVCLSVVRVEGGRAWFDVMQESLVKTTLGALKAGDRVHVERSVTFGTEIGGHIVSGHVTGTAEVVAVTTPENNHVLTLRLPEQARPYVFDKGFIAVSGASLTVVDLDEAEGVFSVWLIPETLRQTWFGALAPGDRVNVEVDPQTVAIVQTVERVLSRRALDAV